MGGTPGQGAGQRSPEAGRESRQGVCRVSRAPAAQGLQGIWRPPPELAPLSRAGGYGGGAQGWEGGAESRDPEALRCTLQTG